MSWIRNLVSVKACAGVVPAILSTFALGLISQFLVFPAFADNAGNVELNLPAKISPRAKDGLFISVANAGKRLVAVGERGRIMLSDDNGLTWRQVETPTSVTLIQVRFASRQDGWAVGQMGIVLHTLDAGDTWTKQFDGIQAGKAMLTEAEGDIAAQGTNSETTANLQAAQVMVGGGPDVPMLTVLPVSKQDVLIAGGFGMLFSSADGGVNWHSITATIPNPNGLHVYDLIESQGKIFGVGEQGLALKGSVDGKFTSIAVPFQGTLFGDLIAPDRSLLAFGLQGTILRSVDQGKDWTQPISHTAIGIDTGIVLRNGEVLLGDIAGNLLLSQDNGKTFSLSPVGEPVVGLGQAVDGSVIVAGPLGLRRISAASLNDGA